MIYNGYAEQVASLYKGSTRSRCSCEGGKSAFSCYERRAGGSEREGIRPVRARRERAHGLDCCCLQETEGRRRVRRVLLFQARSDRKDHTGSAQLSGERR